MTTDQFMNGVLQISRSQAQVFNDEELLVVLNRCAQGTYSNYLNSDAPPETVGYACVGNLLRATPQDYYFENLPETPLKEGGDVAAEYDDTGDTRRLVSLIVSAAVNNDPAITEQDAFAAGFYAARDVLIDPQLINQYVELTRNRVPPDFLSTRSATVFDNVQGNTAAREALFAGVMAGDWVRENGQTAEFKLPVFTARMDKELHR